MLTTNQRLIQSGFVCWNLNTQGNPSYQKAYYVLCFSTVQNKVNHTLLRSTNSVIPGFKASMFYAGYPCTVQYREEFPRCIPLYLGYTYGKVWKLIIQKITLF